MKLSRLRHALASTAICAFSATGHAQTAAPDGDAAKATGPQLGEIIVTAQRRSESLQSVPIAITSADAEVCPRVAGHMAHDLPAVDSGSCEMNLWQLNVINF